MCDLCHVNQLLQRTTLDSPSVCSVTFIFTVWRLSINFNNNIKIVFNLVKQCITLNLVLYSTMTLPECRRRQLHLDHTCLSTYDCHSWAFHASSSSTVEFVSPCCPRLAQLALQTKSPTTISSLKISSSCHTGEAKLKNLFIGGDVQFRLQFCDCRHTHCCPNTFLCLHNNVAVSMQSVEIAIKASQ